MTLTAQESKELNALLSVQNGTTGSFDPNSQGGSTGSFSSGDIRRGISADELRSTLGESSFPQNLLVGLGHGFTKAGQGVEQLGLLAGEKLGLTQPGTAQNFTRNVDADQALYNKTPVGQSTTGDIGDILGQALPYAPLGGAGEAGPLAARLASSGGAGLLTGLSQFVPEGGSRALNTATGGLLGAVAPEAIRGVSRLIGGAVSSGQPLADKEASLALGEQFNVPVYGPDIGGPSSARLSTMSEQIPLGMTKPRLKQSADAAKAAQAIVDSQYDNLNKTKFDIDKISAVASEAGHPKQKAAFDLIQTLDSSGDDWKTIVKNSGDVSLLNKKIVSNQLYSDVENLSGNTPVPYNNTASAIQEAFEKAKASGDERQVSLISRVAKRFLDDGNKPVQPTFTELKSRRTTLSDDIGAEYSGAGQMLVGRTGAALLQPVKVALDKDMEEFAIKGGGPLKNAWLKADKYYKENVIPYKNNKLAKALSNDDPDKVVSSFVKKSTTPHEAKQFYNALDSKGKAAVQYGIVDAAMDAGVNKTPKGGVVFSPARFAQTMESLEAGKNQFYGKQMREKLDGFTKLMRITQRAGQVAENPPTGFRNTTRVLGGTAVGAVISPVVAKAAALGIGLNGLLRYLWTTNTGTKLLIKASKNKVGQDAIKELNQLLETEAQTGRMQRVLRAAAIQRSNNQLSTTNRSEEN